MSLQNEPTQLIPRSLSNSLPPAARQTSYFLTGALAGASTLPIEYAYQRPNSLPTFLRNIGPSALYRAGLRFWTFDLVKSSLNRHTALPVWVQGGLGGAAGGFVEVAAQSLVNRKTPVPLALGTQSLKLFFCFGTYTFLSTTLSEELPPKPFPWCWTLGAVAGGTGSGIVAALEGVRGRALWTGAVPRGAITIGTVIAVQVTSCAALLEKMDI